MRSRSLVLCLLVLTFPLQACQNNSRVLSPAEKAACRDQAEKELSQSKIEQVYKQCLDSSLKAPPQAKLSSTKPVTPIQQPTPQPNASDDSRYLLCRIHSEEIADLRKRLGRANAKVITASTRGTPNSREILEAETEYNAIVNKLDQLLPATIRRGLPLLPEALDLFTRCDREELK